MALSLKTKRLWEFARQKLSCNNIVDPLRPLVVMAAEKVAAHILADKDTKLAPHHAALIISTGIKRRKMEGTNTTRPTYQPQKKVRRDEQKIEGG